MDRFIGKFHSVVIDSISGLKSNMDRFIVTPLPRQVNAYICLKSNMDRFIEYLRVSAEVQ